MLGIGQIVNGKYKLLRLLGDGGMASVYEAEHLGLGTRVAIKFLHAALLRRPGLIERFLQEARVSAQIRSPHVVQVVDVDRTQDGFAYLVMELLEGETLSTVVRRQGRLGSTTAREYTLQILEALEAAHALGVIHRDLKPDNVFVTFQGGHAVLKLIDFGIAKLKRAEGDKDLTAAGTLMGTPEYMAPEQAYSADKVDVTADLYSVGVMFYEMLAGVPPVHGDDPRVVIGKVERGEITPLVHAAPDTAPELAGFVHRAMAPQPALRFSSATEMRLALEALTMKSDSRATLKLAAAQEGERKPEVSVQDAPVQNATQPLEVSVQNAPVQNAHIEQTAERGGTVMGAPAASAFTQGAPQRFSGALAPPGDVAYGAPPGPMPGPPLYARAPFESHASRPRKGSGLIAVLAVVAFLLVAGAVVAYVLGKRPSEPAATEPFAPPPPLTAAPPPIAAPPHAAEPSAPPAAAVSLKPASVPAPPHPAAPAAPSNKPAPSSSVPSAPSSRPPPPFGFPAALPSAFPLPSAIPLPSAFPFPSAFPGIPWPAPSQ